MHGKKNLVIFGSLSEMICKGLPQAQKIWFSTISANCGNVILDLQGLNLHIFVSLSTTTQNRIVPRFLILRKCYSPIHGDRIYPMGVVEVEWVAVSLLGPGVDALFSSKSHNSRKICGLGCGDPANGNNAL
eukprot:jgi/Botrbrau1/20/Bobra.0022s0016.1